MLSLTDNDENNTIIINHNEYALNLAYPNVLKWFEVMDSKEYDDLEKLLLTFELFVGDLDDFKEITIDQISSAVKEITALITKSPYGDSQSGAGSIPHRFFSYKKDADAIYASFMYDYGIDLLRERSMSWFKFSALFNNLSSESPIMRIISIRRRDTSKIEDVEEKQQIEELQNYYALEHKNNREMFIEQQNALGNALLSAAKGK